MSARPFGPAQGRRNHTPIYPAAEPGRVKRGRMAEAITRYVSASGSITKDELLGAGFSQREVDLYFAAALDKSGVKRLEDTL